MSNDSFRDCMVSYDVLIVSSAAARSPQDDHILFFSCKDMETYWYQVVNGLGHYGGGCGPWEPYFDFRVDWGCVTKSLSGGCSGMIFHCYVLSLDFKQG